MDAILVKIFATALTLSEVLTHPASVRTHFDPATDQDQVVQVLRAGCNHMRRAFDIETINLDDLISTALDDSAAFGANAKAFHGINFADLNVAYHRFCKNEVVDQPSVDLAQVIEFYQCSIRFAGRDGAQERVLLRSEKPLLAGISAVNPMTVGLWIIQVSPEQKVFHGTPCSG